MPMVPLTTAEPAAAPLDCDVIVVNYNAAELLLRCVDSALVAGAGRVVVVDNGSADDSMDLLQRRHGADRRVHAVLAGENLGFARACNLGLRHAPAARVLFLNPDGVLAPDALAQLARVLDRGAPVGMVGPLLCDPDGREQAGGRRAFPTPGRAVLRAFGLAGLARRLGGAGQGADFLLHEQPLPPGPVPVPAISGACMMVSRAALDAVGGWDEGYFLHCEDLDWCLRFQRAGWQVWFVPAARVWHDQGYSSRPRRLFVEWHKHRGMLRFYRKFYRDRYPAGMWWLVAAGVGLRFALVAAGLGLGALRGALRGRAAGGRHA